MDNKKIESAVKMFLEAVGEDPNREGLKDTPDRVARMCNEVLKGMEYSNKDIARMYGKKFKYKDDSMVIVKDIPCFSYCEHHLALMYDMKISVAYLPKGYVIGLSKIARIADMVCKRLQLQEKIGSDIADVLSDAIGVEDIAVIISGKHSCVTARGIKKDSETKTATLRGKFRNDSALRSELYAALKD